MWICPALKTTPLGPLLIFEAAPASVPKAEDAHQMLLSYWFLIKWLVVRDERAAA